VNSIGWAIVAIIIFVFAGLMFAGLILYNNMHKPQTVEVVRTPGGRAMVMPSEPETTGHAVDAAARCKWNGPLPDSTCSPGSAFPLATIQVNGVAQADPPSVIVGYICVSGYTKNVRNVPTAEKDAVFAEYGIVSHKTGEYEIDHIISLELGGDNEITNLYPQPALPEPGFHTKDKIENCLHAKVCSGAMKLADVQQLISTDWTQAIAMCGG
jgi:hypothetical protein